MDKLLNHYQKLIREVKTDFLRYTYEQINWKNRLVGLKGARGVGKTTLILQHIKNHLETNLALYVTVEDFYFASNKLIDLAADFVKMGGRYLFIDEIHKYKDWSTELKLIYDYHPDLMVVFTGSAILDINKGAADLSRRAVMYEMKGLSFREYLMMFHGIKADSFSLDDILKHRVRVQGLDHPLPYFANYVKNGYYPFALEDDFQLRIEQILNHTLESDIPQYADINVATSRKLKQLLAIVAQSVPFKPNFSKIGEMLSASRNSIADYLVYMEEAGLIAQLRDSTGGIRGLSKVDKVYLDNTNLISSLAPDNPNKGNIRETFFFNQTKVLYDVTSSPAADFLIHDMTFEIGGKNKKQKQLKGAENSFVVKDDIEFGYMNSIPLWQFGLLY